MKLEYIQNRNIYFAILSLYSALLEECTEQMPSLAGNKQCASLELKRDVIEQLTNDFYLDRADRLAYLAYMSAYGHYLGDSKQDATQNLNHRLTQLRAVTEYLLQELDNTSKTLNQDKGELVPAPYIY